MAWIEARPHESGEGGTWRVLWRQTGLSRRQTELFGAPDDAAAFKRLVEGSGNHWPRGWVPGLGYDVAPAEPVITFAEWAEQAIRRRTKANERTKADYRRDVAKHVAPYFGPLPLGEITADRVQEWVAALLAIHLAPKTIGNLHGLASSIMEDALAHRPPMASHNPFAGRLGTLPDVRTEDMEFLTPGEFDSILAHIPDWYRPLTITLVGTGLRYGEATALQVRQVDLLSSRPTLSVVRAWKRQTDSSYVAGEPKTRRSRRTLTLSTELVDVMLPMVAGKRGNELVFPSVEGHQLLNSTYYDCAWQPAVARARVCERHWLEQRVTGRVAQPLPNPCTCPGVLEKQPRVHDLRHTHVSMLIAEGIPLPAISRRLGHASITTTMDRYGHLMPDMDDDINAAVDRVLTRR